MEPASCAGGRWHIPSGHHDRPAIILAPRRGRL